MKLCVSRVKATMALIALFCFFASYALSQDTDSTGVTVNRADYVSYLKTVEKEVQSTWKFPPGVSGAVVLRFVLDSDGNLTSVEVVNSSDAKLNGPAIEAMNRASPFPRIPEELKKLAGEPLVIKFNVTTKPK